jgi:hypothetical protein
LSLHDWSVHSVLLPDSKLISVFISIPACMDSVFGLLAFELKTDYPHHSSVKSHVCSRFWFTHSNTHTAYLGSLSSAALLASSPTVVLTLDFVVCNSTSISGVNSNQAIYRSQYLI